MARLGDIVEQIRGVSYKPEDLHIMLDSESIALLRANNIQDGYLFFEDVVYVDRKCVKEVQHLRKDDILICTSSGSKDLVGKAAVVKDDVDATFGAFCKVIRVKKQYPQYVARFFDSPIYRERISRASAGANINNIRSEHIAELDIPIPSLEAQRHIAAVLDKVSDLIALRKQQLAKLDELAKARFVEMFGDPEDNSKTWPIQPLEQLCSVGSSKRIYQNEQSADGVPFWRISDLVSKMDTDVADSGLFIPEKKYSELKQAGLVPAPGDILLTSRGTLGRCYIIKADDRFYFQDGMISWLSDYTNGITPLYLQYLFTMPGFRKQIDAMQAGSTVAYLSISMIKKLQVMVPSAGAQASFATFVAQVDKSKSIVQQGLGKLETLKSSLMQEYFG